MFFSRSGAGGFDCFVHSYGAGGLIVPACVVNGTISDLKQLYIFFENDELSRSLTDRASGSVMSVFFHLGRLRTLQGASVMSVFFFTCCVKKSKKSNEQTYVHIHAHNEKGCCAAYVSDRRCPQAYYAKEGHAGSLAPYDYLDNLIKVLIVLVLYLFPLRQT